MSEEKTLVIIVKHTVESSIVSSKIFPRVFLHLGLKFPSDREGFLVEKFILLSFVRFGQFRRREKWETNEIINNMRQFSGR